MVIASPVSSATISPLDMTYDPVGDLDGLLVVGRRDEHRDALGGEDAQRAVDVLAGADVDAAGRLDEHEDVALALQPAAQQHLLLVAARQRAHRLARVVARADRQLVVPASVGACSRSGG